MDKNRDDIIRKLFERSLEPKERGELNNYEREFEIIFKKVKSRKTSNLQRVATKWSPVKIM